MADGRDAPDVSVVVPTREREEMLGRAVRSCFASAGGEVDVEVVVAVDGGRPSYGAELAGERVVVLAGAPHGGRGRARNRGLDAATGTYVKFLDDDDWLEPGALAEEVRAARASGASVVASGHFSVSEGTPPVYFPPPAFADGVDSILRGEAVPTAAALYLRSALGAQRWDERATKLDDWHFFALAALSAPRIARLDRPVYTWFAHPGQGVRRATMLDNAREFYWVLDEIERTLARSGQLTAARSRRLAQYRYKELRVLCRYDRPAFERETKRIRALDSAFFPRDEEPRRTVRLLARILGLRKAALLVTALGRAIRRERSGRQATPIGSRVVPPTKPELRRDRSATSRIE